MTAVKIIKTASNLLSKLSAKSTSESALRTIQHHQRSKVLNADNINPNIVKIEFAVQGLLDKRAGQILQEIKNGVKKPFKEIIRADIGDAQAMGQKPITFYRQILACVTDPALAETVQYPEDVQKRAKELLSHMDGGSVGSYTWMIGINMIRSHVAAFIEQRDGHPSSPLDVALSPGAATAIKWALQLFANVKGKPSGIMVPIPLYPLYSTTISEYGLQKVKYYLHETKNWTVDINDLEQAYQTGSKHCQVRAIVVINPGNPTGQVLTRKNIEDIIAFAHKHTLFIIADEVYQDVVYTPAKFYSFKKVMRESQYATSVELASFMSVSKGYVSECGLRGAWMELVNMDPVVQDNLYKNICTILCPTTLGQVTVDCYVRPPVNGEPSYDLFMKEKTEILNSLKEHSELIVETFNKIPGIKCSAVQGAAFAFPRIELPQKAIEAAKEEGKTPDLFYAFRLLEETGICVLAGSGFEQGPGTYHFRMSILPLPDQLKEMLKSFQQFHEKFIREFS